MNDTPILAYFDQHADGLICPSCYAALELADGSKRDRLTFRIRKVEELKVRADENGEYECIECGMFEPEVPS